MNDLKRESCASEKARKFNLVHKWVYIFNITHVFVWTLNISYSFYISVSLYEMFQNPKQLLGLVYKKCFHPRRFSAHGVWCDYSAGIECSLVVLTETDPAQHATKFVAAFCHIAIMKRKGFVKKSGGDIRWIYLHQGPQATFKRLKEARTNARRLVGLQKKQSLYVPIKCFFSACPILELSIFCPVSRDLAFLLFLL